MQMLVVRKVVEVYLEKKNTLHVSYDDYDLT